MANKFDDSVHDAKLAKIATSTNLTFCSSEPENYAGIAAVKLASVVLTAGDGNGDYSIGDGPVSGRMLTVAAQLALAPSDDGTITYATLDDGVTLLAGADVEPQAVLTTETWDSPAILIKSTDPT